MTGSLRALSPHVAALVAFGALALAAAVVVQDSGPNQAAHFALVRALAAGTAEIDPRETIDAAYVDGRYYAAKAPGLGMFTLPWYGALRAAGLQDAPLSTAGAYRDRIWELNLFGAVLPMLVLLLLMFLVAERVVPGYGLAAAVLLGAGTLLLPFSTLFFDHMLSAALGFASFAVLFLAREHGRVSVWSTGAAGMLAGLAIVAEFPLGIVAVVLGVYAAAGGRWLRESAAYVAGLAIGLLPLLLYNTLVFGSPTRLSYTNALEAPVGDGPPVVGANDEGFYGVGAPDPRAALSLLFSEKGLLVVAPIAVAALFGLPLVWRGGRRSEALVCVSVPLLFLVYNAAYYLPYGGQSPGPRFLVPALPFLVLPLAVLLRSRPLVVAGIGLASVVVMAVATFAGPLTGVEYSIDTWLEQLAEGETVATIVDRIGLGTEAGAVTFVALLALACAVGLSQLPLEGSLRREGPLLVGVLGAWLLVVLVSPELLPADEEHGTAEGTLAVLILLATIGIALHAGRRSGWLMLLILAPMLVLAAPQLAERPRVSFVAALAAGAVAMGLWAVAARRKARADTVARELEAVPDRELASRH